MKIGQVSGHADYDAKIVIGHKSAHLHLTVVHTATDAIKPFKMLGSALESRVGRRRCGECLRAESPHAFKFTSEVPAYYLFAAPRGVGRAQE